METTKIYFGQNFFCNVETEELIKLGWELDIEENYHISITVDEEGETFYRYQNTEKAANGIDEGSDSEHTGDNEQTIKDLEKLYNKGLLWDVREDYY